MNQNLLPQARTNDLVTQEMPNEVLVYDLKNHKAHCLNQTAAAVWKHCDGKTSVLEMTALIRQDSSQTMDEAVVWQAVDRLSKANLLVTPLSLPAGMPRHGRREALRRLSIGSALAVPLVMSIVAPTALAGCTFPNGQGAGAACCTDAQCSGPTLICCPATATCLQAPGSSCSPDGTNAACCSGTCTGGKCA